MNFRRLVSAVAALAVAGTMCAGLAVTASAATTELYERGTTTAWSSSDATTWGGSSTVDETYGLYTTGTNSDNEATYTISPSANSIITIDAYWVGMSNTGRYFSNGCASYFRFGNIYICQNDQDSASGYTLTGSIAGVTNFTGPNSYRSYDISTKNYYVIHIEVDTSTNTLTSMTVKSSADLTKDLLSLSNVSLTGTTDYTTIATGFKRGASHSNTHYEYLKSLTVTETTQDLDTATYTIKYVCDNTEIQDSTEATGVVGNTPSIDTSNLEIDGTRYIYVSDDASAISADDDTVITITYRVADTFDATLTSSVDGSIIASQEDLVEGDSTTLYYPAYVIVDNVAYASSSTGNSSHYYGIDLDYDTQTSEITYSETNYSNVVYYSEAENIDGMTVRSDTARMAGGAGAYATSGATVTTLPAGTYVLLTATRSQSSSDTSSLAVFTAGEDTITFDDGASTGATSYGYLQSYVSDEFTVDDDTVITVKSGSGNANVDYILIAEVTPAITNVEVTTTTLAAETALTGVGDTESTSTTAAQTVTNYLIKVANYTETLGNPTIYTETEGATELKPAGEVTYGYSAGGYKYFVIQTIGIGDATKVGLSGCDDYTNL